MKRALILLATIALAGFARAGPDDVRLMVDPGAESVRLLIKAPKSASLKVFDTSAQPFADAAFSIQMSDSAGDLLARGSIDGWWTPAILISQVRTGALPVRTIQHGQASEISTDIPSLLVGYTPPRPPTTHCRYRVEATVHIVEARGRARPVTRHSDWLPIDCRRLPSSS